MCLYLHSNIFKLIRAAGMLPLLWGWNLHSNIFKLILDIACLIKKILMYLHSNIFKLIQEQKVEGEAFEEQFTF